jgi:hypothetical protein
MAMLHAPPQPHNPAARAAGIAHPARLFARKQEVVP